MNKKIVLAGGTGFVGKYFAEQFKKLGYDIIIISRQPNHVQWGNSAAILEAIENSEMVINLAGKSVDCRYTEQNKAVILSSRIETTKALGEAILQCKNPPPLWINSSSGTLYRYAEDHGMTEDTGEVGTGFSVGIVKQWEGIFFSFHPPKTRQVALRITIVLGKDGGAVKPLANLVRFGLGGQQGNGNQMFSWVHIEDLYQMVLFFQKHQELNGSFNCASPNAIKNKTLMKTFRNLMKVKIGLPSPKWLLEIGALIIKTQAELILKSHWVLPEKLMKAGFTFKYPDIELALKDILTHDS